MRFVVQWKSEVSLSMVLNSYSMELVPDGVPDSYNGFAVCGSHTRVLHGHALGLPQLLRFLPRSAKMANQLATYSTACRKSNRLVFSLLSIAWTWLYSQTYPGFFLYRCLGAPHAPTSMYNVRSVFAP